MNGLQDVGLPLVAGLLLACSDVCADGKVQECEDVLTIVFDAPLRFEGAYSLEITGPFEVSCSFAYPISTSPACTNAIPIATRNPTYIAMPPIVGVGVACTVRSFGWEIAPPRIARRRTTGVTTNVVPALARKMTR